MTHRDKPILLHKIGMTHRDKPILLHKIGMTHRDWPTYSLSCCITWFTGTGANAQFGKMHYYYW